MVAKKNIAILIPVYNDDALLCKFLPKLMDELLRIEKLEDQFESTIILVDDGSKVPLKIGAESIDTANLQRIKILRHNINLGQGAALQTGIEFAFTVMKADYYVTMDSDGQHSELDLYPMLRALWDGDCEIIFGNRFSNDYDSQIPITRRLILRTAVAFERWLTGLCLNDSHNGFRVFTRECASKIDLKLNRMAHATEFKQIVSRNKIAYKEHFVRISYTSTTLAKGQQNSGAFLILRDLFKTYLFERF